MNSCTMLIATFIFDYEYEFKYEYNFLLWPYYLQEFTSKHNDDFELYVTIDRFYKANATLPTKTPTDFI